MWVDVFKWAIFGDRLSLDVDKLVLVGNYWNKEIEDFMLRATRKQFPKKKNHNSNDWINHGWNIILLPNNQQIGLYVDKCIIEKFIQSSTFVWNALIVMLD